MRVLKYIQEMKYDLVYYADKKRVSLGSPSEVLEDGEPIKDKQLKDTKWKNLTSEQKKLPIS